MLAGHSAAVGLTEEVSRRRTAAFALFSEHGVVPTTNVPPEGFETKMKQLSPQPIKLRLNKTDMRNTWRGTSVALRKMHIWPITDSRCPDYGGGKK
jgi:hypothetical protein